MGASEQTFYCRKKELTRTIDRRYQTRRTSQANDYHDSGSPARQLAFHGLVASPVVLCQNRQIQRSSSGGSLYIRFNISGRGW